ncbi:cytochrome P450, partial [Trifolium medium]|nr:cytochrome P450 [Trifolium medium]
MEGGLSNCVAAVVVEPTRCISCIRLRKYVADPSHVIELDDVQVRDNLTVETIPLRIEGRE